MALNNNILEILNLILNLILLFSIILFYLINSKNLRKMSTSTDNIKKTVRVLEKDFKKHLEHHK